MSREPWTDYHAHPRCDVAFRTDGFDRRLRMVIALSGLSVRAFAASVGYDRRSAYRWLRGDSVPNGDAIATICRTYDVSADWLLGLIKPQD